MKTSGIISLLLCLGLALQAQIMVVPREKLDAVTNPRLSDYSSSLKFETISIQAEPMNEDDGIQTYVFPYENVGKDTLTVTRLISSCSCAAASCKDVEVPPGEMSEIVVRYNPKGHPGRFERKVFVYVCGEDMPAAVLRLSVNVEQGADWAGLYPVSMGNIRVRRAEVNLRKGVKAVENCAFVNVCDKPLKLECDRIFLPKGFAFRTEPSIVDPGTEGKIIIEYDPAYGAEKDRIPVIIKGLGVPPSQSMILVTLN